ncbi:N/A [soil metagenome]
MSRINAPSIHPVVVEPPEPMLAARHEHPAPTPHVPAHRAPRDLVGSSAPMHKLRRLVAAVAAKDCTVLVRGESGTGKELVARTIHEQSKRAAGPFVAVDCTGLRDTLLESQLFGHVKGAFTGADQNTLGFIRSADGGTLFLDEIGELEPRTQAKLLRVIQERLVTPLGSVKAIPINVRILAATHRDLKKMVALQTFREDLYFRLDVVGIAVPNLAERKSDLEDLANHFLARVASLYEEPVKRLSAEALKVVMAYDWPGNVRELANVIEHGVVFSRSEVVDVLDLPERLRASAAAEASAALDPDRAPIVTLEAAERGLIARALKATGGNQSKAAELLCIERRRLYRKVARYGLKDLVAFGDDQPE